MFFVLIFVFLCKLTIALANFLNIKSLSNVYLTGIEELNGAVSQIECTLKCRRKSMDGFYSNDKTCFCTFGIVNNGERMVSGNYLTDVG